jgi:DNA (cytosine-5)-methyltransferase 1
MFPNKTVIDLFAGCGGLSTGLELSGFNPILVSELNDDAKKSYIFNRHTKIGTEKFSDLGELHFGDIYSFDKNKIQDTLAIYNSLSNDTFKKPDDLNLSLLCGGPPCQGFSGIGHRRTYKVDKEEIPSNRLYLKMIELIELFKPKLFLFENVKGILTGRWNDTGTKGDIWKSILGEFKKIENYYVKWSLVHAKDYGVPQNRPRVLLVGMRSDVAKKSQVDINSFNDDAVECGFLPMKGSEKYPDIKDLLDDLIDPAIKKSLLMQDFNGNFDTKYYLNSPRNDFQKWLRTNPDGSLLEIGDRLTEHSYSKHKSHIVDKFSNMIRSGGSIPEKYKTKKFAQRVLPKYWGPKGPSITATSLPDDYVHYCQPRTLSVREWARLQTFPDWYQFAGKRTTGGIRRAGNPIEGIFEREVPKYTQIGNAVPVKLAESLGYHFSDLIK